MKCYAGTDQILNGFKEHFETLAKFTGNPNYDTHYHELNMYETRQISDMTRSKEIQEVSLDELEKAIKSLNK